MKWNHEGWKSLDRGDDERDSTKASGEEWYHDMRRKRRYTFDEEEGGLRLAQNGRGPRDITLFNKQTSDNLSPMAELDT